MSPRPQEGERSPVSILESVNASLKLCINKLSTDFIWSRLTRKRLKTSLTLAIWSNFPKSSLSMMTNSLGEQSLAKRVKPTMSAYRILTTQRKNSLYYHIQINI